MHGWGWGCGGGQREWGYRWTKRGVREDMMEGRVHDQMGHSMEVRGEGEAEMVRQRR